VACLDEAVAAADLLRARALADGIVERLATISAPVVTLPVRRRGAP
jgi:hypothetical protein